MRMSFTPKPERKDHWTAIGQQYEATGNSADQDAADRIRQGRRAAMSVTSVRAGKARRCLNYTKLNLRFSLTPALRQPYGPHLPQPALAFMLQEPEHQDG